LSLDVGARVRGGVLALLAGDALGVPVEGMGRDEFEPVTAMRGGGSHGQPPGTWSDAGSLTLITIESLLEKGDLDETDLADRFVRWLFNRHWTARRVTFKVGFTTREGIVAFREGKPAQKSGLVEEDSNGNGSLMRMLPLAALAHARNLDVKATTDLAHRASRITHAHPRAMLACWLYSLLVRGVLDGLSLKDALARMRGQAAEVYGTDPWNDQYASVQGLMEREWRFVERSDLKSSGYVVHTFEAALWCALMKPSLRDAVLEAVNLGEDTDTVAAVTGSLAGLLHGPAAVPDEWRKELARLDEIEPLLDRFVGLLSSTGT
jgi:ADP-ribosylglycohydrolase